MNLNLELIQRNGYTVLDLLSDVGGILEISSIVITYFLAFWNYNYFENYLVTRLYKLEKEGLDEEAKKNLNYFNRSTFIQPRRCYNPKEWIRDKLPRFLVCKCLRPDRLERGFEKARAKLLNDINIIEILKSRRYYKRALKMMLPKQKRMLLYENSRYLSINPDKEEQRKSDKKLNDTSAPEYTDGFYTSESEVIELAPTFTKTETDMRSRENHTALGNYPGRRTPTPLAMAIIGMQNRNVTQSFGTDQDWSTPAVKKSRQRYDDYDKSVEDSEQVVDQHMQLDVPLASPKTEDQDRNQEVELHFPDINQRREHEFIDAATNYPWLMDIEKQ